MTTVSFNNTEFRCHLMFLGSMLRKAKTVSQACHERGNQSFVEIRETLGIQYVIQASLSLNPQQRRILFAKCGQRND